VRRLQQSNRDKPGDGHSGLEADWLSSLETGSERTGAPERARPAGDTIKGVEVPLHSAEVDRQPSATDTKRRLTTQRSDAVTTLRREFGALDHDRT